MELMLVSTHAVAALTLKTALATVTITRTVVSVAKSDALNSTRKDVEKVYKRVLCRYHTGAGGAQPSPFVQPSTPASILQAPAFSLQVL